MAIGFAGGVAYLIMPHVDGLWLWALLAAVIGSADVAKLATGWGCWFVTGQMDGVS
jgi:hypothetical protein